MSSSSDHARGVRAAIALLGLLFVASCARDVTAPAAPLEASLHRGSSSKIKSPALEVSDEHVRFEAVEDGANPEPEVVRLKEKYGGTLEGLTIVSATPAGIVSATLDGTSAPTKLRISAVTENLDRGEYEGSVVVDAPGADNSPAEIRVKIKVKKAKLVLTVATAPDGALPGVAFTTQPVIEIQRAHGRLSRHFDERVTASLEGCSAALGGTTAVRAHDGVATFTNLSISAAGTCTLVFTSEDASSVRADIVVGTPRFALTVMRGGTGTGTVTSDGGGINCGSSCSALYDPGTFVLLTATGDPGSVFSSWSGGTCASAGSECTVTMDGARTETANFEKLVLTSVSVSGAPGSLTVGGTAQLTASPKDQFGDPIAATVTWASSSSAAIVDGNGLVTAVSAGTATITATATSGAVSVPSSTPPITISSGGPTGFVLTVAVSGDVSVTSDVGGISCPGTCTATFTSGATVVLTALPGDGTFAWGGDCSGAGFTCTLEMTSDKSVSASLSFVAIAAQPLPHPLLAARPVSVGHLRR